MDEKAIQNNKVGLKYFLGLVEYNFTLWNHLNNPSEINSNYEQVCNAKIEVAL